MDLGQYRGQIGQEAPAGVDLDESGQLLQLDMISRWSATEGEEPDWPAVRDAAAAALERSRDLRAAVYLCAALLNTEGVRSFCDGLSLLRSYVEELWDHVYPQLDGEDAIERSSAVFNLINFHRVLRPLKRAPLVEDRVAGRFSLQDLEIARGKAEPPADYAGEPPQESLIVAAFQAMDGDELAALDRAVAQGVEDLRTIESVFQERAGATATPDTSRLRKVLADMRAVTRARLEERGSTGGAEEGPAADGGDTAQPAAAPEPAAAPVAAGNGVIRTRQDAVQTMDRVIQYFRANEPSSPVPLLLERAKRLVDMDFMAILEDLAPDGVNQARAISGKPGQE